MASKLQELEKLDPKKKAGVLVGSVIAVYVLFSAGVVGDLEEQAAAKTAAASKIQKEVAELKKGMVVKVVKLDPENDPKVLGARLEAYKNDLPTSEEFAEFVKFLKKLADKKGLDIRSIKRLDTQPDDYVRFTPISIAAEANFPTLVKFLTTLSKPGTRDKPNRIVTIESIVLKSEGVKDYLPKGIFTQATSARGGAALTEDEIKRGIIRQLDAYEFAARKTLLEVDLTLHVFTYTGKPLTEEQIKKRKKKKRKKGH
jgi:Tfp pilus assembly protein PilO